MSPRHPLVGLWFHSFDRDTGECEWQGRVLSPLPDGRHMLVQLYDWIIGAAGPQRVVPMDEMARWTFYATDEELREAHTHRHSVPRPPSAGAGVVA